MKNQFLSSVTNAPIEKVSLSFKIFLQTFTDQNVPLLLYIETNLKEISNLGLLQVNSMKER